MVIMVKLHLFENESDHPEKPEDDVFGHGKVVVDGAKGFILMIILIRIMKTLKCIFSQMIAMMMMMIDAKV